MGKYDILSKRYFGSAEIASELIGVGVFRGKKQIRCESLMPLTVKYPALGTTSGEYERDALFWSEEHQLKYGIEVENYNDFGMARRIFVYNACEYEKSFAERKKSHVAQGELKTFEAKKSGMLTSDAEQPIIDIVLYLGMGHYKGQRNLREGFCRIPQEILPYISDKIQNYGFVLIEADYVNIADFTGELRQFFEAMQARNNKEKLKTLFLREDFQNLSEETQQVIAIHLGQKKLIRKVLEEKQSMCKAMRDIMKESREEGIEQGIEQNLQINLKNLMQNLSLSLDQAMNVLGVKNEQRERCRELLATDGVSRSKTDS